MDELNDAAVEAYRQGHADAVADFGAALGAAALAAGHEAEQARSDGWWDGFAEGLLTRSPYYRQHGYGLGRARRGRSTTRPSAVRTGER